mmetsp:Transcript_18644/g.58409  ORF Transcript_18644/g.58409 Transcript_18644/m.58409 type:complete len:442 (+) Transcript_18644:313-1638(+)
MARRCSPPVRVWTPGTTAHLLGVVWLGHVPVGAAGLARRPRGALLAVACLQLGKGGKEDLGREHQPPGQREGDPVARPVDHEAGGGGPEERADAHRKPREAVVQRQRVGAEELAEDDADERDQGSQREPVERAPHRERCDAPACRHDDGQDAHRHLRRKVDSARAADEARKTAQDHTRGESAYAHDGVDCRPCLGTRTQLLLGELRQKRRRGEVSRHAEKHVQPPAHVARVPAGRHRGPGSGCSASAGAAGDPLAGPHGGGGLGDRGHPEGGGRGAECHRRGDAAEAEGPAPTRNPDPRGVNRREDDGAQAGAAGGQAHGQRTALPGPGVEHRQAGQVTRAEPEACQSHGQVDGHKALRGGGQQVARQGGGTAGGCDGAVAQPPRDEEPGRQGPEELRADQDAVDRGGRIHARAKVGLQGWQEDAKRVDRAKGEEVAYKSR